MCLLGILLRFSSQDIYLFVDKKLSHQICQLSKILGSEEHLPVNITKTFMSRISHSKVMKVLLDLDWFVLTISAHSYHNKGNAD